MGGSNNGEGKVSSAPITYSEDSLPKSYLLLISFHNFSFSMHIETKLVGESRSTPLIKFLRKFMLNKENLQRKFKFKKKRRRDKSQLLLRVVVCLLVMSLREEWRFFIVLKAVFSPDEPFVISNLIFNRFNSSFEVFFHPVHPNWPVFICSSLFFNKI